MISETDAFTFQNYSISKPFLLQKYFSGKEFRSYGFKGDVNVNGKSTESKSTEI